MFFFTFHVVPKADSGVAKEFAGAYVNCWIDFKSRWGARKLAELAIDDSGWLICRLDRERETGRELYEGTDRNLQYFEEAEKEGWAFVYNTYTHDAPDKDEEM